MFDLGFLLLSLPVILIAITLHEAAHAKVADMLGDPTPRLAGRLTLNPLQHIDPIGFLMLILVRFGWAKPVPINPYNFKDPNRGEILVSLAGPSANFFSAWVAAIILKTLPLPYDSMIMALLATFIWISLALAIFNLIPIPPLDGSKILEGFLPYRYKESYYQMQQYSFMLLIMVVLFAAPVLMAVVEMVYRLLV